MIADVVELIGKRKLTIILAVMLCVIAISYTSWSVKYNVPLLDYDWLTVSNILFLLSLIFAWFLYKGYVGSN